MTLAGKLRKMQGEVGSSGMVNWGDILLSRKGESGINGGEGGRLVPIISTKKRKTDDKDAGGKGEVAPKERFT